MPVAELTRDELVAWGRALGGRATRGAPITLAGEVGAGKTTLVQAIAEGLGVRDDVTSPTYGIAHRYESPRGPVWHFDLYRLRSAVELPQVGLDDALRSGGVVLIEWPEVAEAMLPERRVALRLEHMPGDAAKRRLHWSGAEA